MLSWRDRIVVITFALLLLDDSHDDEQIAGKAECRGDDNPAGGEDAGIELLVGAARACHQQVADDDEHDGDAKDFGTG